MPQSDLFAAHIALAREYLEGADLVGHGPARIVFLHTAAENLCMAVLAEEGLDQAANLPREGVNDIGVLAAHLPPEHPLRAGFLSLAPLACHIGPEAALKPRMGPEEAEPLQATLSALLEALAGQKTEQTPNI